MDREKLIFLKEMILKEFDNQRVLPERCSINNLLVICRNIVDLLDEDSIEMGILLRVKVWFRIHFKKGEKTV